MTGLPGFSTSVTTETSSDGEPSCFSVKARNHRVYFVNGSIKVRIITVHEIFQNSLSMFRVSSIADWF